MSFLVDFGIVILAALVHATLQLNVGGLLLLYHASLGKNVTKKTQVLASNFILGVASMACLGLMAAAFVVLGFFGGELGLTEISLLTGLTFALAIIVWFVYYRCGYSTELWLPKSVIRFVNERARKTNSRVEAFSLGMLTCLAELPFSAILVVLAADAFLKLSPMLQLMAILLYVTVAVMPLLACRIAIKKGKTVAKVQRWRVKNQRFLKIFAGVGFVVLGVFLIAFKVAGSL